MIIPDGVKSIGNSAFRNCYDLESVTITDSTTFIGDKAFDMGFFGHSILTITVRQNSFAEQYCKGNELQYTVS